MEEKKLNLKNLIQKQLKDVDFYADFRLNSE
jgi:hypothetical protein